MVRRYPTTILIYLLLGLLLVACGKSTKIIYVVDHTKDQHDGNKGHLVSTIQSAIAEAQELLARDQYREVVVQLPPGIHKIESPLKFPSDQFNLLGKKFILRGDPHAPSIISGGIEINQWKKSDDGLWWAEVPKHVKDVRELFIDDHRATRARHPNHAYLRTAKVGADKRTHFFFESGDFPIPENERQTELILLHDWSISRIPIREIDLKESKLTAVDSIGAKVLDFFTLDHWEQQPRYFLENDRAFLDQDYEWFFDRMQHKVAIKIAQGSSIDDHEVIIPQSEGLISLHGLSQQMIKNIHFENIHFQHSAWHIPALGYGGVQATHFDPRPNFSHGWSVVPAAVQATYADSCTFAGCSFEHLGGGGLWLGQGCRNNIISHCTLSDISGNGIMIGEGRDRTINGQPWWKHSPDQAAQSNQIINSNISHCGQQFFGAVGIWCGLTRNTKILDNEIHDLPYTGVSIGWMWNPTPTPARENIVAHNHIHHIMNELSDGGGIYMLGLQPGSKLMNNLIHDVTINVGRADSNGMFLDEGITDILVAENIIYNIAKSPIRFHKATTNTVRNNYLFCGEDTPPFRYNRTDSNQINKIENQIYHLANPSYHTTLDSLVLQFRMK